MTKYSVFLVYYRYLVLNLKYAWRGLLKHPLFVCRLTYRRILFTFTRRFVGETLHSPFTGEPVFNVQSLANHWAMHVVGELNGPWQQHIRETPAPIVFDAGSNIGQFRYLVKSINPGARVYTFDPWPEMEHYVPKDQHRAIALNSSNTPIKLTRANHGWTATSDSGQSNTSSILAPAETLDDEWKRLGSPRIALLKIDVDGGEFELLRGGQEALANTDYILIETAEMETVQKLCPFKKWTTNDNWNWTGTNRV
jgi:FkbM family methyltransferase